MSWALLAEPSIPEPEPAFPGPTSFVASSVHRIGKLGAFYTTDLRLFNTDANSAHDVILRFSPVGDEPPRTLAVTLPPARGRACSTTSSTTRSARTATAPCS